ncbi:MAG: hypothetical protein L3K04_00995 [Thermoplasmata archaeon]|nr:hypothetical protein [Thermoplasmata archaeon]MCI4340807.1 hypothetical protein [Thermoplasmata archaeon]
MAGTDGASSGTHLLSDTITASANYTLTACNGSGCSYTTINLVVGNACNDNTCTLAIECGSGACANFIIGCLVFVVACNIFAIQYGVSLYDSTWTGTSFVGSISYQFAMGDPGNHVENGMPIAYSYGGTGSFSVGETAIDTHSHQATNTIDVTIPP